MSHNGPKRNLAFQISAATFGSVLIAMAVTGVFVGVRLGMWLASADGFASLDAASTFVRQFLTVPAAVLLAAILAIRLLQNGLRNMSAIQDKQKKPI